MEPVVETTEEELSVTSPALFSKLLIRRCHVGVFKKEKLVFCKITTKALLKPHSELVALVTLRVPPVLTVVESFLILAEASQRWRCVLR